jgi:hypothetical protein
MTKSSEIKPNMYVPQMDAVLNAWFTRYEEARASLEAGGGYLLPYKGQFFVTQSEGIRELGLDPDDSDWARIGWDWIHPKDPEALNRLREKWEQAGSKPNPPSKGRAADSD